jgi:peroxiredoxin Q/BCP
VANEGILFSAVHRCVSHPCAQKELPYPLLSDRKRVLIGALGAADGQKTKRSHFVFAQGGKLLDKKVPVKPADRLFFSFSFLVWTQY